ncbi:MAG: class I SAM-dependent methyltransferase [Candidatus Promineifilaceae bacterium]
MTEVKSKNPYDEFPYPHLTHSHTHPERMETLASMLGMKPAPADNCRVLELGCAAGFNLFPMAYALPGSHFTGLDYSSVQIDYGLDRLKEIELANVELRCMDIMDIQADLGLFDYIIVHGLYSWVPDAVRDQIMVVCRQNLAPEGIAYISYNTYPGWSMMGMVRGMMQYRVRDIELPMEKAYEARQLIEFLSEAIGTKDSAYGAYLATYLELIRKKRTGSKVQDDTLILHDELEEFNEPVYFYQFVDHASGNGLQYLVESDFSTVIPSKFPPEVGDHIRQISQNTVDMEQYLDFLNFRTFRRTLLCHKEIDVNRMLGPKAVFDLHLLTRARLVTDGPEDLAENLTQFRGQDGANFTTDHPLTVAAFIYLERTYPRASSFRELIEASLNEVSLDDGESITEHATLVAANFLRAYSYSDSLVEFHMRQPNIAVEISDMPEASMIARWQLDYMVKVTNVRHVRVELDDLSRRLLRYVDGKHNREELIDVLTRDYQQGKFELEVEESPEASTANIRELLTENIDKHLQFFSRASLLIA